MEIKSGVNPRGFEGLEEKAVNLVHEFGMTGRTLYSSFDHNALMRVRALDHNAPIGLFVFPCRLVRDWDYAKGVGAEALHPYYPTLMQPGFMDECNKAGVIVRPWTVDDPDAPLHAGGRGGNNQPAGRGAGSARKAVRR